MSWPNGGVCPVASLVPAGAEGRRRRLRGARLPRRRGRVGFQGSFACLAAWAARPRSPSPSSPSDRSTPTRSDRTPPLNPRADFANPARAFPPRPSSNRSRVSRHPPRRRDDGGEGVVVILRAAHVVLETSTGVLRACPMEWRLAQPRRRSGWRFDARHVESPPRSSARVRRWERCASRRRARRATISPISPRRTRPRPRWRRGGGVWRRRGTGANRARRRGDSGRPPPRTISKNNPPRARRWTRARGARDVASRISCPCRTSGASSRSRATSPRSATFRGSSSRARETREREV